MRVKIKLFGTQLLSMPGNSVKPDVTKPMQVLEQQINDFLVQHPDGEVTWLQSTGGSQYGQVTQVTAVISYNE